MLVTMYLLFIFGWLFYFTYTTKGEHCRIENIALGKPTNQSSTKHGGLASHAVDGINSNKYWDGSCSHTEKLSQSWWMVNLGDMYNITSVIITNRLHTREYTRLKHFDIRIWNSSTFEEGNCSYGCEVCYHQQDPLGDGQTKQFPCKNGGQLGRLVQIILLEGNEPLTLCEVQVIGEVCSNKTLIESPCRAKNVSDNIPRTHQELEEKVKTLKQEMKVEKKETSANKRKLISAPDDRPSSQYIGCFGIIIIVIPVVILVAMDISRLFLLLKTTKRKLSSISE